MHVCEYIEDAISSRADPNARLSIDFWTVFWEEFDLESDISAELVAPADGGEVAAELRDHINFAQNRNPAARKPEPLIHYLLTCDELSALALFGVLQAMQCGPTLCTAHARRIQVAVLKYCARFLYTLFAC